MKKWIIIIALIGAVGWIVSDFVISNNTKKQSASESENDTTTVGSKAGTGLEKGNLAPDFELKTTDGETVQLSDFRGEKVLLNFWATWCPPCRAEMPDMQKYYEKHDDGVILAVNLVETEQGMGQVEDFLAEYGITFQILLDESTEVSSIYDAYALPTSYLINKDGTIYTKAVGAINYDLLVDQFEKMN